MKRRLAKLETRPGFAREAAALWVHCQDNSHMLHQRSNTRGSVLIIVTILPCCLQAGGIDEEDEEEANGNAEDGAEQSAQSSTDVAAVEGMLSGLALSDSDGAATGPDQAVHAAVAPDTPVEGAASNADGINRVAGAAPEQELAEAIQAVSGADAAHGEATAAAAADENTEATEIEPDLAAAAAEDAGAEAGEAEPDLAAAAAADDKLVEEAEQQLAQLQLGAGKSTTAKGPLSEQQAIAAEPQVEATAAGIDVTSGEGADYAVREDVSGTAKPAGNKMGSFTKKVHEHCLTL